MRAFARLCFTPSVRRAQARWALPTQVARVVNASEERRLLDEHALQVVRSATSLFLATCNSEGWPHVQHRGGEPGFVTSSATGELTFVDLDGNGQMISVGNLDDNPRTHLLFIDSADKRRLKVWGTGRVRERSDGARLFELTVYAWDWNCGRLLPPSGSV